MNRKSDYQFVSTNSESIIASLTTAYEKITGRTLHPADPDKIFISWVSDIIIQERAMLNYVGNQNIPSRAEGKNLDALGELIYSIERNAAKSARCTMRFVISKAQETSILIPAGTRVTDASHTLVWSTIEDTYIPIGDISADVIVQCETAGVIGNGYVEGQIKMLIDVDNIPYYSSCSNINKSDGGAEEATDDEYYELMRASMDGYSCAGAKGSYIFFAKQVSTEIADVVANRPAPGEVSLYLLMKNGTVATSEIKAEVLAACNDDEVRPLTDKVSVEDPEIVHYDINFTYYIPQDSTVNSSEIQNAVNKAVDEHVKWQAGKLGRDINPSHLHGLLMQTGIKRIDMKSPNFTTLRDGKDNTVPQIAVVGTITTTNGGYEDE